MEKKEYKIPEIEVVEISNDFIITTSQTENWNDDEDFILD